MALPLYAPNQKCDTVSSINKVLSQIKKRPDQMSPSFFKYNMAIHRTLKSKSAALLFSALEYRFRKMPEGFYKFMTPCENSFYRKGDSFSEELGIGRVSIWLSMKKICTSYKSKTLYLQAIDELGEIGAFDGKPYLSYHDRRTGQTFFLREYRAVNRVLNGTYKCDNYATKVNLLEVHKSELTVGSKSELTVGSKSELLVPPEPAATKAETAPSEKTLQRIPISLSLSNDNCSPMEQPKEENENLVIVEQPSVMISTIDQMIVTWKKIVQLDGEPTPKKGTVDNLAKAYSEVFSESLSKWREFCKLVVSSKYLMGETPQKFKLNLAWVAKPESIDQIISGHFTTGDRTNVIYLDLEPISDPDPIILKFKQACLDKIGKERYISWIKPMKIKLNEHKEVVCIAPTSWAAKHLATNDFLGFEYFINQLPISAIVLKEPNGNVVARIVARNSK